MYNIKNCADNLSCPLFILFNKSLNISYGISPRHNIKAEDYKDLFNLTGEKFIIGGDFNAKHTHWRSRLITPKGKQLLKAPQEYGCDFMSTGKPTYWPTDRQKKTADLIDFSSLEKFQDSS